MVNDAQKFSVSVCTIAHNEESTIGRAIESVIGWAREVIVIDTNSTDSTTQRAEAFGATVLQRPNALFVDSIRNEAFAMATSDWILFVDADEVIPDALKREITDELSRGPEVNGYKIPRRNFYFSHELRNGGNYPDNQLRLFRRGHGSFRENSTHESIVIDGSCGSLKTPFEHYPYPTFEVWMKKFLFYTEQLAEVHTQNCTLINARTIRHHMVTRPMRRWISRLFVKRGLRDGVPGVLAATFDLMTQIVGFGRYWIKQNQLAVPSAEPHQQNQEHPTQLQ